MSCIGATLVVSSVVLLATSAAPETTCKSAECSSTGRLARESLLLQFESNATFRSDLLPELPPAYTAASEPQVSGVGLVQRDESQMGSPSDKELEHFRLLKELRTNGFSCKSKSFPGNPNTEATFQFDCRLWRAARLWSEEMGSDGFFDHVRGDSTPCVRTAEQGLRACGENIAAGNADPGATLEQWKNSDGHCTNMMNPSYNRFGIGHAMVPGSTYIHYWTQALGTDGEAPDQSCLTQQPEQSQQPTPPPTQPPTQPSTQQPMQPAGPCRDTDMYCATLYKQYCSSLQNVRDTCPKTCGVCPTLEPTQVPTQEPTREPTQEPTQEPTREPTQEPTQEPCVDRDMYCTTSYKNYCYLSNVKKACPKTCDECQSQAPTQKPTQVPTPEPTLTLAQEPTPKPTLEPMPEPTPEPMQEQTQAPTQEPTQESTQEPLGCVDKDVNCERWYKSFCRLSNIKRDCPQTCNAC